MQKTLPLIYITIIGVVLFFSLYVVAAVLFPGGSYANINDTSFSFIHNYWCDLLAEKTKRGELNPGRPYSLSAMFIMCPSMMIFFVAAPVLLGTERRRKRIIQITGFISMLIAMFIFTPLHDAVIPSSGIFGLISLGYLFAEIRKNKMAKHFAFGMFCLALMAANNFIWYTGLGVEGLPLLQKITFIAFLGLIIYICTSLIRVQHKQEHFASNKPLEK